MYSFHVFRKCKQDPNASKEEVVVLFREQGYSLAEAQKPIGIASEAKEVSKVLDEVEAGRGSHTRVRSQGLWVMREIL